MPRKKPPAKTALNQEHVEKATTLLLASDSLHQVRRALVANLKITDAQADELIKEVRRRLALAAKGDFIQELGRGVKRLNDLYQRSIKDGDTRAALACQKELNRLRGLGPKRGESTGSVSSGEIEAARAQLLPLNLTPKDAPLAELCRLAVAKIVELQTEVK